MCKVINFEDYKREKGGMPNFIDREIKIQLRLIGLKFEKELAEGYFSTWEGDAPLYLIDNFNEDMKKLDDEINLLENELAKIICT